MIEQSNHPAVVGTVGAAGYTYTFFGLPMSDVIGWLTAIAMLISIISGLPKAIKAVRDWLPKGGQNK